MENPNLSRLQLSETCGRCNAHAKGPSWKVERKKEFQNKKMWPVYVNRSCFQCEFSAFVELCLTAQLKHSWPFLWLLGVAVGFTITLVREAIEFWMMATIGGILPWWSSAKQPLVHGWRNTLRDHFFLSATSRTLMLFRQNAAAIPLPVFIRQYRYLPACLRSRKVTCQTKSMFDSLLLPVRHKATIIR